MTSAKFPDFFGANPSFVTVTITQPPCQGISLINHIYKCLCIVTGGVPMMSQVEDDSADYFVAEHREKSTPRRRCCQLRRRIKGRRDFKTMVSPASSQVFSPSQKMFIGQYKYVNILCPKRPNTWRICIPFHLSIWSHNLRRPKDSTCNSLSYKPYNV